MNKVIAFLSLCILFVFFNTSCDDKDNVAPPPSILGKWVVEEQTIKTNHPNVDVIINNLMIGDKRKYQLIHNFEEKTRRAYKIRINSSIKDTTNLPSNIYSIEKDTLILGNHRMALILGYGILTTRQQIVYSDVMELLAGIDEIDPNSIVPTNIKGELRIKELKASAE